MSVTLAVKHLCERRIALIDELLSTHKYQDFVTELEDDDSEYYSAALGSCIQSNSYNDGEFSWKDLPTEEAGSKKEIYKELLKKLDEIAVAVNSLEALLKKATQLDNILSTIALVRKAYS